EDVNVGINRIFPQILKYPDPANAEEARFSLPHIVTAAISGESMSVDTFTEEKVRDPRLVSQRGKVRTTVHPEWGDAQMGELNTVTIRTRDGRIFERECRVARGDPSNPLTRDELVQRYLGFTANSMTGNGAQASADMLSDLENLKDTADLMRLYATA
ncbi:MAG: hypothetical protein WEB93_05580, partial [Sphingomonadales bacterium]